MAVHASFIAGKEGSLFGQAGGKQIRSDLHPGCECTARLGQEGELKVFVKLLEHAHIRPVTPVGGYMWDEMYRVQDLAVSLQGEPKALLDQMKQNVEAELAKA